MLCCVQADKLEREARGLRLELSDARRTLGEAKASQERSAAEAAAKVRINHTLSLLCSISRCSFREVPRSGFLDAGRWVL